MRRFYILGQRGADKGAKETKKEFDQGQGSLQEEAAGGGGENMRGVQRDLKTISGHRGGFGGQLEET